MMFQDKERKGSGLNREYLYLDRCLTKDQMIDPGHLRGIHCVSKALMMHANAGAVRQTKEDT